MLDLIIGLAQELKAERMKTAALEAQMARDKPKVVFAEAVERSDSTILIGDLAKILRDNGVKIEQEGLFTWLRENGYLTNTEGEFWNMPTRESMERGLFEVKKSVSHNADGSTEITRTVKVTGRGQIHLVNKFLEKPD